MLQTTQDLRRVEENSFPPKDMDKLIANLRSLKSQAVPGGGHVPSGIGRIDALLPGGGLARAALHEVVPEDFRALPASWGFLLALAKIVAVARPGPFFWPLLKGDEHEFGVP